jgi:hypothetical protein
MPNAKWQNAKSVGDAFGILLQLATAYWLLLTGYWKLATGY